MKVNGSCHCGRVTFVADVDPKDVLICHCTDCQVLSGSAFRTVAFCPESAFELTGAAPKVYIKTAESGRQREQVFCERCGAQIYATSVGDGPRHLGLRVGTLAERDQLVPRRQLWSRSAQSWLDDLPTIPAVEKQPDAPIKSSGDRQAPEQPAS